MSIRQHPGAEQQLELFTAMFTDIATRDSREAMELPFLSLSKSPRFKPIIYKSDDVELVVTGGAPFGIANIWDWDLMMWLISQIRQAVDSGVSASRKVRFHRHAFLRDVRRAQGGSQYRRLEDSIARLKNTNVVTTIRAKGKRTTMFSWIEYAEVERDKAGNLSSAIVVVPEWLYEAVVNQTLILSLHRDYFLLTGGLERWLYRLIRKGAGRSHSGWKWSFRLLHERSGSAQGYKYFSRDLRKIIASGKLLDYELESLVENGECYVSAKYAGRQVSPRVPPELPAKVLRIPGSLRPSTYEEARAVAPGYDIYALEADWKRSCERKDLVPDKPDAAFLGWCRAVHAKNPLR